MKDLPELFGSEVFNEHVMKTRLPKDTYRALKNTIREGKPLSLDLANVIASTMKDWAVEKGATHFTHWFQPMTGVTAGKHDSFISPTSDGGVIMEFSGKSLVRGEPDASSFPSGGLRSTFEARGYTAWDPTSYAFIKDDTLCIPTAFCSYGGHALDKKTPLLRSMDAIDRQALRVLSLFGNEGVSRVTTMVGPEQEYFLIDRSMYKARPDIIFTGRTLFGAKPPKGQELDDHYYGAIKARVSEYMKDLDEQLWKLGIFSKTKHYEVAPGQHEMAPIFTTANIASDHNQLVMEMMKKVAKKHDMVCLLSEKPFEGVNGSGKHNNWSLRTNTGVNIFDPGDTPGENLQFLIFLAAVIKAVDEYQDLLRISVASASNDRRLGGNEAPIAIISVFLGDELTEVLQSIEKGELYHSRGKSKMAPGARVLPKFTLDTTDRNRTSPFAFTGNRFEFRMLGSASSIADANTVLNTIVAEELRVFADRLEGCDNFDTELENLLKETVRDHKRIIFNGNNYSEEWEKEAERRGLCNYRTTVDCIPHLTDKKNVELFERHKVFSEVELAARKDIDLENYAYKLHIEALTLIDMCKRGIIPAVLKAEGKISDRIISKNTVLGDRYTKKDTALLRKLSGFADDIYKELEVLEKKVQLAEKTEGVFEKADYYKSVVLPAMEKLRTGCDSAEEIMPAEYWPYPTYAQIMYSVR